MLEAISMWLQDTSTAKQVYITKEHLVDAEVVASSPFPSEAVQQTAQHKILMTL